MRPTAEIHEVRIMRFLSINERFRKKELSCEEAAEILGISLSTFYRKIMVQLSSEFESFAQEIDNLKITR